MAPAIGVGRPKTRVVQVLPTGYRLISCTSRVLDEPIPLARSISRPTRVSHAERPADPSHDDAGRGHHLTAEPSNESVAECAERVLAHLLGDQGGGCLLYTSPSPR